MRSRLAPVTLSTILAAFLIVVLAVASQAAPPWASLVPFKKVEADPKKSYTLTKSSGPWMIMAMSFPGDDDGQLQAHKLTLELRRDHKLDAWIHEQAIDLNERVEGLGVNERGGKKKMKYLHGGEVSEIAVLVGSFKSFDDPDASRVLEKIRGAQVKCLAGTGTMAQRSEFRIRDLYRMSSTKDPKRRGPLARAFITRNPMLPADEVARETLDPFVAELNEGIEFSLLENKAQYTVLIATYRGAAAYSEKNFEESVQKNMKKNPNREAQIDKACTDATKVVAALRKQGVEAYVFHDRHESVVTVGSFDDVGQEMASGQVELHPSIAAVIKKFEAKRSTLENVDTRGLIPTGQVGLLPQVVAGVPLDLAPRLIVVPRKSIADVYRQASYER